MELGFRYDGSPIIACEDGAPAIDPIVYNASTWPGARLPHVFLEKDVSIHDRLGPGFTLIVVDGTDDTSAFEQAARRRGVPFTVLHLERALQRDQLPAWIAAGHSAICVHEQRLQAILVGRVPERVDALRQRVGLHLGSVTEAARAAKGL